ncbi:helix-turn-helix domain-containing protein [Streptomyces sp. NPDC023723]|uniref:helix-turn-helix domain-containing protein n=1 Tax=Streptomyces sp. NPDC023723 TaxID=3154323 RepID=UPI0033C6335C
MHDLIGRITALDPHLSDTLSVVTYFDALITSQASTEALLRGAALLTGCPLALERAGRPPLRLSASGERLPAAEADPQHPGADGDGWRVILERDGEPHANDDMVLERLAMALVIADSRSPRTREPRRAVEILLAPGTPAEQRSEAAARLRLDAAGSYRAVARHVGPDTVHAGSSAVLATRYGLARAEVVAASWRPEGADGPVGVGAAVSPSRLPDSWATAVTALRLSDENRPAVLADDLGALVLLARVAEDERAAHPDVVTLDALARRPEELRILDAIGSTTTVREAARLLYLHHSTVQSRLARATDRLGYDPSSPQGRVRYAVARTTQRLRPSR